MHALASCRLLLILTLARREQNNERKQLGNISAVLAMQGAPIRGVQELVEH
jgi:hypothetical protein